MLSCGKPLAAFSFIQAVLADANLFLYSLDQEQGLAWVSAMDCCTTLDNADSSPGKHISMLEMTKFVPQLLRQIDLEWASPRDKWEISGYWFAKQSGLVVRFVPKV